MIVLLNLFSFKVTLRKYINIPDLQFLMLIKYAILIMYADFKNVSL